MRIVSNSYGCKTSDTPDCYSANFEQAINSFAKQGGLFVVSAGNDGVSNAQVCLFSRRLRSAGKQATWPSHGVLLGWCWVRVAMLQLALCRALHQWLQGEGVPDLTMRQTVLLLSPATKRSVSVCLAIRSTTGRSIGGHEERSCRALLCQPARRMITRPPTAGAALPSRLRGTQCAVSGGDVHHHSCGQLLGPE